MKTIAYRIADARPNKLITLTVDVKAYETPRDAYDATRRQIPELAKAIRVEKGEFEYVRVLETTRRGWPHYHLVARCPYIPQHLLSDLWAARVGAPIVDVRAIRKTDNVIGYVCKYLSKQKIVPWTQRRIAWSRHFFTSPPEHEKGALQLSKKIRDDRHPTDFATEELSGFFLREVAGGIWIIQLPEQGDNVPPAGT